MATETFKFDPSKAQTPYQARKGNIADHNFKGVYIGLRGFIRAGDRAGRWSLKVGEGFGKKGILGRADDQALSLAFGFNARNRGVALTFFGKKPDSPTIYGIRRLETCFKAALRERFGDTPISHSFAGSTETFGDFDSPEAAYKAAVALLTELDWVDTKGEKIEGVDFWRMTA